MVQRRDDNALVVPAQIPDVELNAVGEQGERLVEIPEAFFLQGFPEQAARLLLRFRERALVDRRRPAASIDASSLRIRTESPGNSGFSR